FFYEASDLQLKVTKMVRSQLLPIRSFRPLAIRPKVGRDLLLCIALARIQSIQSSETYRLRNSFLNVLQKTWKLPRSVVSEDPSGNHYRNTHKAKDHPQRTYIIRSQNDVVHIPLKSGKDHESYMSGYEPYPHQHHQKVNGTAALSPAEESRKPGKTIHHC